jgi:hypothetical protein
MGYSYSFQQKRIGDIRGNCVYIKARGRSKEYFTKDSIKISCSMLENMLSMGIQRICILNSKTGETYLSGIKDIISLGVLSNAYRHLVFDKWIQSKLEVEDA